MKEKLAIQGDEKICVIAAVVKDGKLLRGHRHYTPDRWKKISVWTCPGGRCDEGETVEQTLRRETEEETGITDLEIKSFIGEVPGAKAGDHLLIFYATTNQEPQLMEPEKFSEWRWVDIGEWIEKEPEVSFNNPARELMAQFLREMK